MPIFTCFGSGLGLSNFDMFHYSRDVVKAAEANIKGPVILLGSWCGLVIIPYCIIGKKKTNLFQSRCGVLSVVQWL